MRTIIVGCGAVVENHHRFALNELARRGYLEVVGVVDDDAARLDRAEKWFPRSQVFQNLSECYAHVKEVELALVTSPPPYHKEHAVTAFRNGSHVFCEKPIASCVAAAEDMVASANAHKKVLGVGMPRRFYPCLAEARRRIMAGELGAEVEFIYREGSVYRWPIATAAPFRRQTSGGGVLLDKGVHAIDTLYFLFGGGTVLRAADDGVSPGVEANALVELALERARGTLQLSWDMNLNNGLHIAGRDGHLWIPVGYMDVLWVRSRERERWQMVPQHITFPLDLQPHGGRQCIPSDSLNRDCFVLQLVQMLRAVRLSETPAVTGEEALGPLRLIESAYSMAAPLCKPWLNPTERAAGNKRHWRG